MTIFSPRLLNVVSVWHGPVVCLQSLTSFRIVGTPLLYLWHDMRLSSACYHAS
jgi:hypothetical protein